MKILVRATNWVGDAVMSIPALEALRRRWPQEEIVVLARAGIAELYEGQPFANRSLVFDDGGKHSGVFGRERLARELRAERFERAILLQNAFDAAWISWRAGIPQRVGYARDGRSLLLTKAVPPPQRGEIPSHESYYYLELLRRAGWVDGLPRIEQIELRVTPQARARAEEILMRAGARQNGMRIALAPGAQYGSAKCWPPERFAMVGDRLAVDLDAEILLFGTPAEKGIGELIASRMRRRPLNLAGQTKLRDLPGLISSCHVFIGNDSGAMHVAAAVGLPVIAIFGPTDAEETSAVTSRIRIMCHGVSCSPCFLRVCPVDHRCMSRVSTDEVVSAARNLISCAPQMQKGIVSRV